MSFVPSLGTAVAFVWLGMVLAISFLETPLKFRAPDVTIQLGLGIGRLVFRALNIVECIFAATLVIVFSIDTPPNRVVVGVMVAALALLVQIGIIRPRLARRTDRVLAGEDVPRSKGHHGYVVLEVIKVIALITVGVLLLRL